MHFLPRCTAFCLYPTHSGKSAARHEAQIIRCCTQDGDSSCWHVLDMASSLNAGTPSAITFSGGYPNSEPTLYSPISYVGSASAVVGNELYIFGGGFDRSCDDTWNNCLSSDPKTTVQNKLVLFNGTTFQDATTGTYAQRVYGSAVSVRQAVFTLPKSCRDPLHAELPTLDEVSVPPAISSIPFCDCAFISVRS